MTNALRPQTPRQVDTKKKFTDMTNNLIPQGVSRNSIAAAKFQSADNVIAPRLIRDYAKQSRENLVKAQQQTSFKFVDLNQPG